MSYLQLAENRNPLEAYVRVPAEHSNTGDTQYIREDLFDDLDDGTYNILMEVLDFQGMSEGEIMLQDKAARLARRQARQDRKQRKKEARTSKIESKAVIKQKQASGEMEKAGLKNVLDTVTSVFGKNGGANIRKGGITTWDGGYNPSEGFYGEFNTSGDTSQWITGFPNWAVIAGGSVLLLGTVLLLTRKGKKSAA